ALRASAAGASTCSTSADRPATCSAATPLRRAACTARSISERRFLTVPSWAKFRWQAYRSGGTRLSSGWDTLSLPPYSAALTRTWDRRSLRDVVLELQRLDLVLAGAAGALDGDHVADGLAHQGAGDGGGDGDPPLLQVRLRLPDDPVGDLLLVLLVDQHHGGAED